MDAKGLSKAVAGWLFTNKEITISQKFDFSQFDLDYLLQLILGDDEVNFLLKSKRALREFGWIL